MQIVLGKIKNLIKNLFVLLYYLPGFIQKPAIHHKIVEAESKEMPICYCVCHAKVSSKAYCEHCKARNHVGRYWQAKSEQEQKQLQEVRNLLKTLPRIKWNANYENKVS